MKTTMLRHVGSFFGSVYLRLNLQQGLLCIQYSTAVLNAWGIQLVFVQTTYSSSVKMESKVTLTGAACLSKPFSSKHKLKERGCWICSHFLPPPQLFQHMAYCTDCPFWLHGLTVKQDSFLMFTLLFPETLPSEIWNNLVVPFWFLS